MNIVKMQREIIKKDLDLNNKRAVVLLNRGNDYSLLEVAYLDKYNDLQNHGIMIANNKLEKEIEKIKNNYKVASEVVEVDNEKLVINLIEKARNSKIVTSIF